MYDTFIESKLEEIERFCRAVKSFSPDKITNCAIPHFHKLLKQLDRTEVPNTAVQTINNALEKYYESVEI